MLSNIGARIRRWRRCYSRAEWEANRLHLSRNAEGSHAPGLLLIQIDGLSRVQFERAVAKGRMPFLAHLMKYDGGRLHTFYAGLPTTTPAVQGELYYGVRTAVPAFSFLDPRTGNIGKMLDPEWAKRIEADLAAQHEGLLKGGSSWSNIYTGGAEQKESHFCGASIGLGDMWASTKLSSFLLLLFLHLPSLLRLAALLPVEFVLSLFDAARGAFKGHNLGRELRFIILRVFVCIGLRELIMFGVKVDLARGLPIIHANFLGYDEQSHRRGPSSLFAHWTLRGIDRAIRHMHRAAHRSEGRDYEVWIFSDHGQIKTRHFSDVASGGLEGALERFQAKPNQTLSSQPLPVADTAPDTAITEGHLQKISGLERAKFAVFAKQDFAVACLGPVGHIYFKETLIAERKAKLVAHLLEEGVPGVLTPEGGKVIWHTRTGKTCLPNDTAFLRGPKELLPEMARDLAALACHPYSGDVVCLGWSPDGTSFSFADENGAHAGPSPEETQGFLLLPPASAHLLPDGIVRPSQLRSAAQIQVGRASRPIHRRRPSLPVTQLRVVSYNVHYCKGLDGRFAPERTARVLRDLDPDIVALQEIDCGRLRSRHEDQLGFIAAELGLKYVFCPSIEIDGEQYGHGLLAREEIHIVKRVRLPVGGVSVVEPRDAMRAMVSLAGRKITLVGTHLGLAFAERQAQIDRLLQPDLLGGIAKDQPGIFLGDLNLSPGGKLYRRLVSRWSAINGHAVFRDAQAHAPKQVAVKTFPSFLPLRQLDHIFVTHHFRILSVYTLKNMLTRRTSDHLPLVADLELHE